MGKYLFLNTWTTEGTAEPVPAPVKITARPWSADVSSWGQCGWSPMTWPWTVRDPAAQVYPLPKGAFGTQLREWGSFSRQMGRVLSSEVTQVFSILLLASERNKQESFPFSHFLHCS